MIGIDTNILVRLYAQDDPVQSKLATEFLENRLRHETGYVSQVVIAELVWVLTRVYALDKAKLLVILTNLMISGDIEIEQAEIFATALRAFQKTGAQFTDLLIASTARHAGCSETFTFDESAAKKAGMTLLRSSIIP
jgi:predicted nucleic-acid-binding protein